MKTEEILSIVKKIFESEISVGFNPLGRADTYTDERYFIEGKNRFLSILESELKQSEIDKI